VTPYPSCSAAELTDFLMTLRQNQPEPKESAAQEAGRRAGEEAIRRTAIFRVAVLTASAQHAVGARTRSLWVSHWTG